MYGDYNVMFFYVFMQNLQSLEIIEIYMKIVMTGQLTTVYTVSAVYCLNEHCG